MELFQKWSSDGGAGLDLAEIKNLIRERVQEKLDFRRDFSDAEVSEIIDEVILNSNEMTLMSLPQRRQIHKEANPLYPVPVVWDDEDFKRLIHTLRTAQ